MENNKWIELPLENGKSHYPASKSRLTSVPSKGPFILVSQFDTDKFEKQWPNTGEINHTILDHFELRFGEVTYYLTLSGHILKVGQYIDSSD